MKKTIITLLVVAAVVITVIIIALADSSRRIHQGNDNEWLKLKEIAAITDFFDASINKMIPVSYTHLTLPTNSRV